jgi:oligosaccharyl transferase (archaeosortase A-associated)
MAASLSKSTVLTLILIAVLIIVSGILRALPALSLNFGTYHAYGDPDTWYNFRQIEVMVLHFPQYNWFDPMTAFPFGKEIAWGPAFPFFAAVLSILFGATQRFEIMAVASWVPIIFALAMIPVVFCLGKLVRDWKTGIISAIFIAVISGNYFYESYFGVVDHHIAEVFFTTVFGLFYIYAIMRARTEDIFVNDPRSWKPLLLPSLLAGIAFGVSLLTSPTTILFLVILGVYTILQYSWDISHKRATDHLFIINCIVLIIPFLFLLVLGYPSPGLHLTEYSIAQIFVFIIFILGTIFIQILSMIFRRKPAFFILSLLVTISAGTWILFLINPLFLTSLSSSVGTLFSSGQEWATISELKPWSPGEIWASFNIGIILALLGLGLVIYHFFKERKPESLYISIWAFWILLLTTLQVRWEYYSAVIVSLLSAYTLGYTFYLDSKTGRENKVSIKRSSTLTKGRPEKVTKKATGRNELLRRKRGTILVIVILGVFCGISVYYDYAIVQNTTDKLIIPDPWIGALEWVQTGTPGTNISYYGPYEAEGWQYPPDSYGILSWWDSGHWITFISKRIPVTNPFQDNIKPVSAFYLSESEDTANKIAENFRVRYVITDSQMTFGKFPGIIQWYNQSLQTGYYTGVYYLDDRESPENSGLIGLINQPYYQTMVVRLQNFDGSLAEPSQVALAEISESRQQGSTPIITSLEFLDYASGLEKLNESETSPRPGTSAALKGFLLDLPVEEVSALRHYRLVFEDAPRKPDGDYDYSSSVKVFEYVPGAKLSGDGIIEAKVQTNTGRTFMYRQEAENGYFNLPYPTSGTRYPVTVIGPYRIISSGRTVDVTEDDVTLGRTIS